MNFEPCNNFTHVVMHIKTPNTTENVETKLNNWPCINQILAIIEELIDSIRPHMPHAFLSFEHISHSQKQQMCHCDHCRFSLNTQHHYLFRSNHTLCQTGSWNSLIISYYQGMYDLCSCNNSRLTAVKSQRLFRYSMWYFGLQTVEIGLEIVVVVLG